MKILFAAAFIITISSALTAQADNRTIARELGSILASEGYCALAYDQSAISAWVDANVDHTDMGFALNLDRSARLFKGAVSLQSDSAKMAHCQAIDGTARHYGFIE